MTLKSRVEKIESQMTGQEFPAIDEKAAGFKAYVHSRAFYEDLLAKATGLLQTMSTTHQVNVLEYLLQVHAWVVIGDDMTAYPKTQPLEIVFIQMLKGSIDGSYFGALALPESASLLWQQYGSKSLSSSQCSIWNCEGCGYALPFVGHDRIKHCSLCAGSMGFQFYEAKRGLPQFVCRRNEWQIPILTEHKIIEALGLLASYGLFNRGEG